MSSITDSTTDGEHSADDTASSLTATYHLPSTRRNTLPSSVPSPPPSAPYPTLPQGSALQTLLQSHLAYAPSSPRTYATIAAPEALFTTSVEPIFRDIHALLPQSVRSTPATSIPQYGPIAPSDATRLTSRSSRTPFTSNDLGPSGIGRRHALCCL